MITLSAGMVFGLSLFVLLGLSLLNVPIKQGVFSLILTMPVLLLLCTLIIYIILTYNLHIKTIKFVSLVSFVLFLAVLFLFYDEFVLIIQPAIINLLYFINLILEKCKNICSLNSIWISMGITEFSFFFLFLINVFNIIFLLNIFLVYIEYLDRKWQHTNNYNSDTDKVVQKTSMHLKSGMPELKAVIRQIIIGIGMVGSGITIKNEVFPDSGEKARKAQEAESAQKLKEAEEKAKKLADAQIYFNLINNLNLTRIGNGQSVVNKLIEEETDLIKQIKENKDKVTWTDSTTRDKDFTTKILETRLAGIIQKRNREQAEVTKDVKSAQKFSTEILKETDKKKKKKNFFMIK